MSKIVVLGGGISGRLFKHLYPDAVVLEARPSARMAKLTRLWGTNYLWQPIPGLECRAFKVFTCVDGKLPEPRAIARYKVKIGKPEDIGNWGLQFEHETTGYDFVSLPDPGISYGYQVQQVDLDTHQILYLGPSGNGVLEYDLLINTLPLNVFTRLIGASSRVPMDTMFKHTPIYIRVGPIMDPAPDWLADRLGPDDMYVNYLSDPTLYRYRFCHREGLQHDESLIPFAFKQIELNPGKIKPCPLIQKFLTQLEGKGVFCFGRYASWNPNELVHETYWRMHEWSASI